MPDKTLPSDYDDSSLPGRAEESSPAPVPAPDEPPKSRSLAIAIIAFVVVGSGFFGYYFVNQAEIDSQISDNTSLLSPEQRMAIRYGVGEYGSDHAHAALAVFVDNRQINFGLNQFQLQSRYIHFENHNPYLVHKHATGVPLEMLFASLGLEITGECIGSGAGETLCADSENSVTFVINGRYFEEIGSYEIRHNDRILVSYGDPDDVEGQLEYLDSLEIHDIPRRDRITPDRNISV